MPLLLLLSLALLGCPGRERDAGQRATAPGAVSVTGGDTTRRTTAPSAPSTPSAVPGAAPPAAAPSTVPAVVDADLRTRLLVFADDSMQGRAAGSPGHERALRYLEAEARRLGLLPGGDSVAGRPRSFRQHVPLRSVERDTLWSANIVAWRPGTMTGRAAEWVALGAHSDHIGVAPRAVDHDSARAANIASAGRAPGERGPQPRMPAAGGRRDSIYNGADDDGSGSIALLEIAEAAMARPPAPRGLLFVWHTGEELGLDGAAWFVSHPTVPLGAIVAQLNLDMIGRGGAADLAGGGPDYLAVIGPRRLSSELDATVASVNAGQPRPLRLDYGMDADGHPENIYCRSDHALYAAQGIPVAFFFTNLHADYHEVTDEVRYIDFPHYTRVVQYLDVLAARLASAPARPRVDKPKPDPRAPCRQ